jgi:ketosteroid isomerase-like protein
MKTIVRLALVPTLAGLFLAPAHAQSDVDVLMETSRQWSRAAASGELEAIVAFWADDAVVYAPDRPAIQGKAAIREFVAESMKIPGFTISWEPQSGFVAPAGDFGYLLETNRVTFTGDNGQLVALPGKGVTIWRKGADGKWTCVVDTWNSVGAEPPGTKQQ